MRVPLNEADYERIYQGRLVGKTLSELATELGCSVMCVRKWWRRIRAEGVCGLRPRQRGRSAQGILSSFPSEVRQTALLLKRRHPGWGADRILTELHNDQRLQRQRLPHRSRLTVFLKAACPECVAEHPPQPALATRPPSACAVHQVWKLDAQEGLRLQDGTLATVCNIRDPFGAAMIASQAFGVQTAKHWRKLTWEEYRQVVRTGACEWQTLPAAVQTDGELALAGTPNDPFPGHFTLWLVGLGVTHLLSRPHTPTDNAQVEREHRTLDAWAGDAEGLTNLTSLQQALDRERQQYNQHFPCRASDCAGHPPLLAHPELRVPQRPYAAQQELALFDLQRVDQYLANYLFQRQVSATGVVSLGRQLYSIGRKWAKRTVLVCLDSDVRQWTFWLSAPHQEYQEIARRNIKALDVTTLTGLQP